MKDTLQEVYDKNIRTIKFTGITADGRYSQEKTFQLNQHEDMDVNRLEARKVITMNGYVNIMVELDRQGRLLTVEVERNDDYVAADPFEAR